MTFLSANTVESLKRDYPTGTRVELIYMNDPYSKLVPGDKGTVDYIDDAGTIHVHWDSGSSLGLIYGEDSFRKENANE